MYILNFFWHFFFFFLIFNVIMTRVSLPVIHSVLAPTAKGLGKNLRPSRSAAENMTRTEDFQREETGLSVRSRESEYSRA